MAFFNGCASSVSDEATEFVIANTASHTLAAPPRTPLLRSGALEASSPGGGLDPQQIGRVLTVAVSEIGEHVKSGGELLWRSAVSAAGHALAASPTALGVRCELPVAAASSASASGGGRDVAAAAQDGSSRVWGDANFSLVLKERKHNGDKAGRLVAAAYALDENGETSLEVTAECRFAWRRNKASGVSIPVEGVDGNTYLISGDDIGASVEVCATPKTFGGTLTGRRFASIGPFQVDLRTKMLILTALANGGTRFSCTLASPAGEGSAQGTSPPEVSVDVNQDRVIVTLQHGDNICGGVTDSAGLQEEEGARELSCLYTASLPTVEIDPTSSKRFQLRLSEDTCLSLCASTRHQRDLLALSLRCFQSRVFVSTSLILDRVAPRLPCEDGADLRLAAQQSDPRVDWYCTLHLLQTELQRAQAVGLRLSRDFARAAKEKEALEEEMQMTIKAFQSQLDNALQQGQQQQGSTSNNKALEEVQAQLEKATTANESLKRELHRDDGETNKEMAFEIKRLRAEVEEAHLHKSRVSLELSEAHRAFEQERKRFSSAVQQLKDQLMHAEARADCLAEQVAEMRVSESGTEEQFAQRTAALQLAVEAAEKEAEEAKKQLAVATTEKDATRAERNRLLKLTDSLSKELERSKASSDTSAAALQKLTQSNLQLQQASREQQRQQQQQVQQLEQQQQQQQQRIREQQQQIREAHKRNEDLAARLHAAEGFVSSLKKEKTQLEGGMLVLQQQLLQLQQQQLQQQQHKHSTAQEATDGAQTRLLAASKEASRDSEETARLKAENESLKARLRKLGRLRGAPSSATHEETVPQEPKPETAAPDVGRGTLASVAVSGEEATADETAVSTRPTNSPEEEEDVVVIAPSGARLLHKTLVDGEAERPFDGSSLEMPSPAEIPSSRWRVKPEEKGRNARTVNTAQGDTKNAQRKRHSKREVEQPQIGCSAAGGSLKASFSMNTVRETHERSTPPKETLKTHKGRGIARGKSNNPLLGVLLLADGGTLSHPQPTEGE
ncbi:uncharacterized protein LOC34622443 [Cyclospora cayetanensis]|uniref:Uncharacterized protein LOC34622443 n=1 Tax=Cyclospora cayetanensis TaxID=88456 RepID=A0A6P6RSI2_9EIME|nr:uncharacterized protein LOC34622443 [Cyclospora cayetanensis]